VIDVKVLYGVLREAAVTKGILSHEELSRRYHEATGDWLEPRGGWDVPLAEVNARTKAAGLPPLSAVVTDKPGREDGYEPPTSGFWGTPGVPPKPRKAADRLLVWMGFVNLAYRAAWPEALAGPG
jgi:hypothetical protein